MPLRIAITPGEPAGVGPELLVKLAQHDFNAELIAFADPSLLLQRAADIGLPLELSEVDFTAPAQAHRSGHLKVASISCHSPVEAGSLNVKNLLLTMPAFRSVAIPNFWLSAATSTKSS